MAQPLGRPRQFDHIVKTRVDDETKHWLSAMSTLTGESEAWVMRAVLHAWRSGEPKLSAASNELEGAET